MRFQIHKQDPEVIEPTPPQDHQPSLTDSEVDKENRVVSPVNIDSNIEVPRGADNTVLDYTGLGLDIEFPNKVRHFSSRRRLNKFS